MTSILQVWFMILTKVEHRLFELGGKDLNSCQPSGVFCEMPAWVYLLRAEFLASESLVRLQQYALQLRTLIHGIS